MGNAIHVLLKHQHRVSRSETSTAPPYIALKMCVRGEIGRRVAEMNTINSLVETILAADIKKCSC